MEPNLAPIPTSASLRSPERLGLRWGLVSGTATAALLYAARHMHHTFAEAHPSAMLWGSLGVAAAGYVIGTDLGRAINRTESLKQSYARLETNHLLLPEAMPTHSARLRTPQSCWAEALRGAVIQGLGSAALAGGVEAALAPNPRPFLEAAREWGPVGAIQGAVTGWTQAHEHNRRAEIIRAYEEKAGFADRLGMATAPVSSR